MLWHTQGLQQRQRREESSQSLRGFNRITELERGFGACRLAVNPFYQKWTLTKYIATDSAKYALGDTGARLHNAVERIPGIRVAQPFID